MTEPTKNTNYLTRPRDGSYPSSNSQHYEENDFWYYAEGETPVGPIGLGYLKSLLSHVSDPSP